MSDPFIGEIRLFAGNFAPFGWLFCDGSLLPISEYNVLFALIGTTYGGDGQSTFALPDLRGRVPVHIGGTQNYQVGERGGAETVTLTGAQIPLHNHAMSSVSAPGTVSTPSASSRLADMGPTGTVTPAVYKAFDGTSQIALNAQSIGAAGGSQPHNNIQPTLAVSFIIAFFGIFPPRS
jgi:microcystin-dependent protein